jgi:uncharacterized protein YaiE (UPF0345 family)
MLAQLEEGRQHSSALAVREIIIYPSRPMSAIPAEFTNVTAVTKANVYFDGKVVSHSILFPDGSKKTLGLIYPGDFHFGTAKAERMEIVAGGCVVKLDGSDTKTGYTGGQFFDVPANSGFDISVSSGICEYICSFLD